MSYDDDHDYGSRSSQGPGAKTAEELRQQMQDKMRSVGNIHMEIDDNGNASFLGFTVPKELKPVLDAGLESAKPWVLDFTKNAYQIGSSLANRIGFKGKSSAVVGYVAENALRWGVVGSQQIYDVVKAGNNYAKERREVFRVFAPVMEATGANIRTNEVMKVAMDDIHDSWVYDLKKMANDLPTLIPMGYLALQDQKRSVERRKGHEEALKMKAELAAKHGTSDPAELQRLAAHDIDTKVREAWIKHNEEHQATVGYDAQEERRYFYKEIAPGLRSNMLGNGAHGAAAVGKEDQSKIDSKAKGMIVGASIVSQILKADYEKSASRRKKRVRAWKMIEQLKTEMESQCGQINGRDDCDRTFSAKAADDIRITGMGNHDGSSISLKEYITDLFQQHERDREPSRDFKDKNGKLIDPLKGTLLTNLQPAIDVIADHIADGSLSPDALYKLVGENKVIKHSKSGAKTFASESEVKTLIEKELVPVLSTREVIKIEEFLSKFADPSLIQGTLKKNLETMKGPEKAMFASLFPDDILEQTGLKKKEIMAMRKEAHQMSYDFVAASVMHLAKQAPEEMKKLGVSDEEIQTLANLAEKLEAGDIKALKTAVDGRDKNTIDAIRTAGLLEQTKGGKEGESFWTDRVKEMGAVHQKLKESAGDREREEKASKEDSGDKKWSSSSKKSRDYDRDSDDKWASSEKSGGFSERFDRDESEFSARDRVKKNRDDAKDSSHNPLAI